MSRELEPISKSTVHCLAQKVFYLKLTSERRRKGGNVDKTKLEVKKEVVYLLAKDVDTKELLSDIPYQRCELNVSIFLRKAFEAIQEQTSDSADKGS